MIYIYSLIINLKGLASHMVCYMQYVWRVVKLVRTNRETNEEHDENCVEELVR